jgi:hypothetical protein
MMASLLKFLIFQIGKFCKKHQIWIGAKKDPFHFGQIDFNISNVIGVVFLTSKVKTIWPVILTNEQWTIWLVKLFK